MSANRPRAARGDRVGDAQHHAASGLCQQSVIDEAGIDEAAVMLIGVVARVIDAARFAFAAKAEIERRQAQMLEEAE